VYYCPKTGLEVHGFVANDPAEQNDDGFKPVACVACARKHLVNPATGMILGRRYSTVAH
jgi:hypothetical protein